jgi:hypothetical protein
MRVEEYIKTLKPITDFNTLAKGDRIFNRHSLSVEFVDTFDHIEKWEDKDVVIYFDYEGKRWLAYTEDLWFYYKKPKEFQNNGLDWKSKIALDRVDLISMAKGMKPHHEISELMDIGHFDSNAEWKWNWDAFKDLSDIDIYNIYIMCKNSWKEGR